MVYACTEVFTDYLQFLNFLIKAKKDLERPRDLEHGLATVQLFCTWTAVLSLGYYPLRFQKLFLKSVLREATSFREKGRGFIESDEFTKICTDLHSFLRKQMPHLTGVLRATENLQCCREQEDSINEVTSSHVHEVQLLFRGFRAESEESAIEAIENNPTIPAIIKSNLLCLPHAHDREVLQPKRTGLLIDPQSTYIQTYKKDVEYIKVTVIPQLLNYWGLMAPYLNKLTICESDCIEFYSITEIPTELLFTQMSEN